MNQTQRALAVLFRVMSYHTRGVRVPDHISNCCDQISQLLSWMGVEQEQELEVLLRMLDNHLDGIYG